MRLAIAAVGLGGLLVFGPPSTAPACSLCNPGFAAKPSFVTRYWQAHAVVCGTLENPQLVASSGAGTTELRVEKVLRSDPRLQGVNPIVLPRYIPVLNPKAPPRFIGLFDEKLACYDGRPDYTPAFLEFLRASEAVKGQPRPAILRHLVNYLASTDPAVADETFLLFAQANDREILDAAAQLKPDVFRKLVQDPKLEPERLSLFAFLLGASGTTADADLLYPFLQRPDDRTAKAMEGILAGYILRRPKEGWAWTYAAIADPRQPYLVRWGIVRTLRFLHNTHPAECRAPIVHALGLMVPNGELADAAITDLQQWKLWDHTKLILAQYGRPSHAAPIVRNALVRYALVCPQPDARRFIDELRRRDPRLVREIEEDLAFEQGK